MEILASAGVDLYTLVAFAFICLVSWVFGDWPIQYLYEKRFQEILETAANEHRTLATLKKERDGWRIKLDLDFGRRIGRIERIFYIYAVMQMAWGVLTAWVILKAFFGWIQKPPVGDAVGTANEKEITTYYLYIYGNALSLLTAIALGHVAISMGKLLTTYCGG